MIRRPPRSTQGVSSAASDVYKRQVWIFLVQADAICWNHCTIPARFRYVNQLDSNYGLQQQSWERRVHSSLGRFIHFHFCCAYNITEVARHWLLVRILDCYCSLEVPQGFLFEQEPLLSYCARALIDEGQSAFWVVDYTCLLYTSPSPRDQRGSRMPSSA